MLFAIPIINLKIPNEWKVGRVALRPPTWIREVIEASRPTRGEPWRERLDRLAAEARELRWALAVIEARDYEEARVIAEEHIAVLRVYQRFRYRYVSLDRQTFGLPDAITRHFEEYYALDADGIIVGMGFAQSGVLGEWEFSPADLDAWGDDEAFVFFDELLRKDAMARSEPEKRLSTGLGILNIATASLRPALRHVLIAVALEALLGDDEMPGRAHRIAARSAFLTCDTLGSPQAGPHGPSRPACAIVAYAQEKEMRVKIEALGLPGYTSCSYYENVRAMFDRRNNVLHEGLDPGDDKKPGSSEWWSDHVFLQLARFLSSKRPLTSSELDVEMARVASLNPQLSDATIGKPPTAKPRRGSARRHGRSS